MKPGDFFVGIVDFFSILLPGAFLAVTVRVFEHDKWLCKLAEALKSPTYNTNEKWVAFALASYVLGHLVFHGSAWLDYTYDALYLKVKQGRPPLFLENNAMVAGEVNRSLAEESPAEIWEANGTVGESGFK